MKPVMAHPEARAELDDAAAYYERERRGLGRDFRLEFEIALGRLVEFPELYAIETEDFRACPLYRFPYTIYYPILEDRIWIAAVAHQRRRPGYWGRRRPPEGPIGND